MRMRIGFFADMYLPHVSGITNHMRLYKRYFEQQGHEVFLITFGSTRYDDDEPNVVRSPAIPVGNTGWGYGPAFNKATQELLPTLDIIHAHHPFQSGSYLMYYRRNKGFSAPLVFTNHTRYDLYADTYAHAIPYTQRHKWNAGYLNYFTSRCDLVVAPSAGIVDWLAEYVQCENVQVIPNGIDLTAFQGVKGNSTDTLAAAAKDIGISDGDIVLCYVGRVSHEKNIAYLLSEFASLTKACTQLDKRLKLLVVGDGAEANYVRDFAVRHQLESQILLTGAVDYKQIPHYVALCDAFITGSVSEVHPLVVIEALAAGLPVIAVESPGISDTVVHGKSGLLASSPEPHALMSEAEKIVNDATFRAQLSNGAQRHSECFSLENTAGQLLKSYEKLL